MEKVVKESNFLPRKHVKLRLHSKSLDLPLEPFPEGSKLPLKRKTASLSSLYPPPRPPLPDIKLIPSMQSNKARIKDEIPYRQQHCKCKQSGCLKLYCWCFATGNYCDGCGCSNCQNNDENEDARRSALGLILQRNHKTFKPMFIGTQDCPSGDQVSNCFKVSEEAKDALIFLKYKGCRCKRSRCIQRYCECRQANVFCSEKCECTKCENLNGSKEKFSKELKKKKDLENFYDSYKGDCMVAQNPQIVRPAELGPLKFRYRSLLEGIIKPENVREFCMKLVVMSEAAKDLADKRDPINLEIPRHQNSVFQFKKLVKEPAYYEVKPNNPLSRIQVDMIHNDSNCDAVGLKEWPISPGNIALMCHEKDMSFHPYESFDKILNCDCYPDVYMEQEKLVLVNFRDFLISLIMCGNIEELKSSARATREDQREFVGHKDVKKADVDDEESSVEKLMV